LPVGRFFTHNFFQKKLDNPESKADSVFAERITQQAAHLGISEEQSIKGLSALNINYSLMWCI
jgi:hypothetical protein